MDITETQWQILKPLLPVPLCAKMDADAPGATRVTCSTASSGVLRTGAPWADLPERYPPYQTCHRRFQAWVKAGIMEAVLQALARDLQQRGGACALGTLSLSHCRAKAQEHVFLCLFSL